MLWHFPPLLTPFYLFSQYICILSLSNVSLKCTAFYSGEFISCAMCEQTTGGHGGTWRWTSSDLSHMAFKQVALMLMSSSPEVSYRTTSGMSVFSSISTAKIFPQVKDSTTFTKSGSSLRTSNPEKYWIFKFLFN